MAHLLTFFFMTFGISITLYSTISAQGNPTTETAVQVTKFLKNVVYPYLQGRYGASTSWTVPVVGTKCTFTRTAGFRRWKWTYKGVIDCPGLGRWEKGGCKSRGCAFKEPVKQYFQKMVTVGVPKDELVKVIQNCACKINQGDINELTAAVNSVQT